MEEKRELLEKAFVSGMWMECYKSVVMLQLERNFTKEVVRNYMIVDFIINGEKFLIKWMQRLTPLTDEELKEKFGK